MKYPNTGIDAFADVLISGNISNKHREELRKAEFLKVGQVKLDYYYYSLVIDSLKINSFLYFFFQFKSK
jgi:hypothetical protein